MKAASPATAMPARPQKQRHDRAGFDIEGQPFIALNGGAHYQLYRSASIAIRLWSKLSDGGQTMPCGWLTDGFGAYLAK